MIYEIIIIIIIIWNIVGCFVKIKADKTSTFLLRIFLAGPGAWIAFIIILIEVLTTNLLKSMKKWFYSFRKRKK